jgi:hypothetical protein
MNANLVGSSCFGTGLPKSVFVIEQFDQLEVGFRRSAFGVNNPCVAFCIMAAKGIFSGELHSADLTICREMIGLVNDPLFKELLELVVGFCAL